MKRKPTKQIAAEIFSSLKKFQDAKEKKIEDSMMETVHVAIKQ